MNTVFSILIVADICKAVAQTESVEERATYAEQIMTAVQRRSVAPMATVKIPSTRALFKLVQ